MKFLGEIISIFALLFLYRRWHKLKHQLKLIYAKYCNPTKSERLLTLIKALIIAEDKRFYQHKGIDSFAISRAIWNFIVYRKIEGGSTIEQQLVRVLTGHYERKFSRKMREIFLSSLVDRVIPKSDIPGIYLFIAYYGWRMTGVQQACNRLKIELSNITPQDAASIVARIKYPEPKVASLIRTEQIAIREKHILELLSQEG